MLPLSEELAQAANEIRTWAQLHANPDDPGIGAVLARNPIRVGWQWSTVRVAQSISVGLIVRPNDED